MKICHNKEGSYSVFALMIFLSMVICIGAIIKSAGDIAIGGTVNSYGTLWAKSILGEYDLCLKNRYGLFGFYGDKGSVEDQLLKYMDYSFQSKEYIYYEEPQCNLEGYSLTSTDNLLKQIELLALENAVISYGNRGVQDVSDSDGAWDFENRSITAGWIIESLPSYGKTEDLYILQLAEKIKGGISIESLRENAAVDAYIAYYFKDYVDAKGIENTYFRCEVEYLISGQLSDEGARESCQSKLILMRNMLNLYYLYTCPQKRDSAMAMAVTLTPGPQAVLTQALILEAWAYMEAENDLKILYDNKAVPLLKKDCNWALSLEGMYNEDYVVPDTLEGLDYSNYLGILLCGLSQETELLRIMDLIQINMKYTYCDYFLLKDYYSGLSIKLNVNGNRYEFEDAYTP